MSIDKFDFESYIDTLKSKDRNDYTVILGKKSIGKTVFMKHIIQKLTERSFIIVDPCEKNGPCITYKSNTNVDKIVNSVTDVDLVESKKLHRDIVLDDCLCPSETTSHESIQEFTNIIENKNKFSLSVWMCLQYPASFDKEMCRNIDTIFIFKGPPTYLKKVYEMYGLSIIYDSPSKTLSFANFEAIHNAYTINPRTCLVIHKNQLYWYRLD